MAQCGAPTAGHGREDHQLPARGLPGLCRAEGAPFRTKPQFLPLMIERAIAAGIPFGWVTADEAYREDLSPSQLAARIIDQWLEQHGVTFPRFTASRIQSNYGRLPT